MLVGTPPHWRSAMSDILMGSRAVCNRPSQPALACLRRCAPVVRYYLLDCSRPDLGFTCAWPWPQLTATAMLLGEATVTRATQLKSHVVFRGHRQESASPMGSNGVDHTRFGGCRY